MFWHPGAILRELYSVQSNLLIYVLFTVTSLIKTLVVTIHTV